MADPLPRTAARRALLLGGLALAVAATTLTALPFASTPAAEPPTVAAASDLQFALKDVAELFEKETGRSVKLVFGSSGNFARQIGQGAPFELYLAADEDYVLKLAEEGFTRDEGALYAVGRIVLLVPHGSPLKADGTLDDLRAALDDGRLAKFAIANPEHAPYGRRAEEALRHAGLWERIQDHLVLGENVSQAARFATSGSAQGGIVAYALALSPEVSRLGDFELIPGDWHAPLRQRMVLLKGARETAERFYEFVQRPAARAILREHGFVLPGEQA